MATDTISTYERPLYINHSHWQEWTEKSGIDPELTALAIVSLHDDQAYDRLIYSPDIDRRNDGRITSRWLETYRHTRDGGWWFSGIDILTGDDSLWGCFKPDKPRLTKNKGFGKEGKPIKYEHPPKTPTEAFFLRVPHHIWEKISNRYGVPIGDYTDFWAWVKDHPLEIPIVLTEGVKKAAAWLTAGYVSIGLPGIWMGFKHKKDEFGNNIGSAYLIPQLQVFCTKGRQILLGFDQDLKQATVRTVNQAIATTSRTMESNGCRVKVITWHPTMGKGIDDLLVNHGSDAVDKAYENAASAEEWSTSLLSKLTYAPNLEVNSRYLGDFSPPVASNLICLKAPKGTGKTEWMAKQIEPLIHQGGKVLLLTHRIQLGEELCNRFGIHYITEIRNDPTGGLWGHGLCVDSLHPKSQARFNPQDWVGAWLIIDECQQVMWHLLNSSTCQADRTEILRCFKEVVNTVLSTGGKIFLSDADLRDSSIDYIKALSNIDIEPWICVNNWRHPGWDLTAFNQNTPAHFVGRLIKHLEDNNEPTFISVSGQSKKSKWGTQILEAMLHKRFPSKKILRIDSHSVADPDHPAYGCIANLNTLLPHYDIVIASPSIETGVSITCNHFTSVWGIFTGVQTTDSVRQALSRIRANAPRFIWAVKVSTASRAGNGSTSVKSLLASQRRLFKENIALLPDAEVIFDGFKMEFQTESLHAWAKEGALVNQGMRNYRQTILNALAEEGHLINFGDDIDKDDAKSIKQKLKETSENESLDHYKAVAEADSLTDKEYELLKEKRAKTTTERCQFEKGTLERRYLTPITPELAQKDAEKWHPKIRLEYFLSSGRKHLSTRDSSIAQKQLQAGDGAVFKTDFNRSQLGAKVFIMDSLGVTKLLGEPERELRNSDPDLQKIAAKTKKYQLEIRNHLNLGISSTDTPITVIKRLINAVGWDIRFLRKEGMRGQQQRVYSLTRPVDGRDEVFVAWLERDEAKEQKNGSHAINRSITDQLRDYGYQILEALDSGVQNLREIIAMAGDGITKAFYQLFPHRIGDLMESLGV